MAGKDFSIWVAKGVREDIAFALQQLKDGAFQRGEGDYFAVYQKRILGYGDGEDDLRNHLGNKYGVDPKKIVVEYIGDLP